MRTRFAVDAISGGCSKYWNEIKYDVNGFCSFCFKGVHVTDLYFCRFCVVIRFFHPRHNGQWPLTLKDFYTRSYPLHYFLILILEKEPVFPFSMLNKGTTGTIFITSLYDAVLDWGLNPGPPALEASTLPLGYRGGRRTLKNTHKKPDLYTMDWQLPDIGKTITNIILPSSLSAYAVRIGRYSYSVDRRLSWLLPCISVSCRVIPMNTHWSCQSMVYRPAPC